MRSFYSAAIFFLLFLIASAVHAQAADQQVGHDSSASSVKVADVLDQTSKQEVELLRAQLHYTRDFQDSLLSTVYWALGGTFVLAGLLLGFGWLANFKVYERDKAAMRSELEALLITRVSEITVEVGARLGQIPELIAEDVKKASANNERAVKAALEDVSNRVFALELRRLKEKMESNESDSMALTDALHLMELCSRKSPDELPNVMHFMLKKIDKGGKLTASEITRLNRVLDKLPAHYGTLNEKLRAKLIASDIF